MKSNLIDITVQLELETEKAYRINDGSKSVWVPKSQCELEQKGPVYELSLPEWLAKEKGLI